MHAFSIQTCKIILNLINYFNNLLTIYVGNSAVDPHIYMAHSLSERYRIAIYAFYNIPRFGFAFWLFALHSLCSVWCRVLPGSSKMKKESPKVCVKKYVYVSSAFYDRQEWCANE